MSNGFSSLIQGLRKAFCDLSRIERTMRIGSAIFCEVKKHNEHQIVSEFDGVRQQPLPISSFSQFQASLGMGRIANNPKSV